MTRRDLGPPDSERGGRPSHRTARHHHQYQSLIKDQHLKTIAASRHIGRYACGWREGFKAGAVDALRLAARRLPPEAWNVLDQLADAYQLAASDD